MNGTSHQPDDDTEDFDTAPSGAELLAYLAITLLVLGGAFWAFIAQ